MAIAVGVAAALLRGTVFDPLLMVLALIGVSAPVFWVGEVANLITQGTWHDTFLFSWVPPLGYTPLTQNPGLWFRGLVIPWITLSILYIGLYGRVLRANILETQNEDFVRTARAKGISERQVLLRHTLRTSMITFVSLFGLDFGALVAGGALLTEVVFGIHGVGYLTYQALANLDQVLLRHTLRTSMITFVSLFGLDFGALVAGGALLTEVVFGIHGVGYLTYQALANLDLPTIMATVVYGAFFIVLANTVVDIGYAWLDPRIRPT